MPSPVVAYHCFKEDVMHGVNNFDTHTIKVALTNTAPDVANHNIFQQINEIPAGNGYTAGGVALTKISSGQSNGTYKYVVQDVTITASGGSIGPFRYVVFYNSSVLRDQTNNQSHPLIAYADYGQSITLGDGESFTIDSSQTDGLIQLT